MDDELILFATIVPKPGRRDAASAAIGGILSATRAEPGCREFRLLENADGTTLHLYERWDDEAALDAHHAQPYTRAVFDAYETLLERPVGVVTMRPSP